MAKTSNKTANVFARVEPEVKEQAEFILDQLGVPMSNAVSMFLKQVIIHRGLPFEAGSLYFLTHIFNAHVR